MIGFFRASFILLIGCIFSSTVSFADDKDGTSLVTIVTPQNGESVASTFEVKYQLRDGTEAAYVHIFLDGNYQKDVTSILKNVRPGAHEIMIKAAANLEETLVDWDSVNITVQ